MINSELDIKLKFVEMCKLIFISSKGEFIFPIDSLIHDDGYSDFIKHSDWSVLDSKMKNLIELINLDNSLLKLDVEEEIWDRI
jgi:hypothetical protein